MNLIAANPTRRLHRRQLLRLATLGAAEFVARAGNGVIYYRGGPPSPKPDVPAALTQRIKDIFDPNHLFPELPL